MSAYLPSFPPPPFADFFPPTPEAFSWTSRAYMIFPLMGFLSWTPLGQHQYMGKTSLASSLFNLPGRLAWSVFESIGPTNLAYILYTLPSKLRPPPQAPTSVLGTGLPFPQEILGLLYMIHYANRAIITPLFYAPSMSPIHAGIAVMMGGHQFLNSANIACWLVYSTLPSSSSHSRSTDAVNYPVALVGLVFFFLGLTCNIIAEHTLFSLRRAAAYRRAKSDGKPLTSLSYNKVYVLPDPQGLYKYFLYPHYTAEWVEWTGYWILGGAVGLGWNTPALWFLVGEVSSMLPRAVNGRQWYVNKFGAKRVGRRRAALPGF